jgi:hypothetical protein
MSPDAVCAEFAELLKDYRIATIEGDNFAGEWTKERFAAHGVRYVKSLKPKSTLYQELLPLLNSGRVELLDHPRLVSRLCNLERRSGGSSRDIIDHPRGAAYHDDVVNAVAGVASMLLGKARPLQIPDKVLEWARTPERREYGGQGTPVFFS